MVPRASIVFDEVTAPTGEPVTKFGGQPAWVDRPTWPLSRQTGRPMRFIGQVALDPRIFGTIPPRMAYLFMTDDEEFVDRTYEPEGGENAVVLQPGSFAGPALEIAEGPTLYRMAAKPGQDRLVAEPCELAVTLDFGEELESEEDDESEEDQDGYANKIGGTPDFLQDDEYPDGGPWRLLLQLDSSSVPFSINFGDMGVGYAFLSEDGTVGKFLWQCC